MKVLHICMSQYSDGWAYQENLLAKYHKLMGHDVSIITSMYCYKEGKLVKDDKVSFIDSNGVNVVRLEEKSNLLNRFPIYNNFYETIELEKPDIIFSHGCQYIDVNNIVKYKKNYYKVRVYVDNHADFTNSAKNWLSKNILHKIIWKKYAQKLVKYTEVFWGVLPSRVDFLTNIYNIPKEKVKLLVMGADDYQVKKYIDPNEIENNRKILGFGNDDFIIVSAGKFDSYKKGILSLMKAVKNIESDNIKLIIFGSIEEDFLNEFKKYIDDKKIFYLGWANYEESYKFFSISKLAVFNGRHSVYWEQAAGQGIPLLVKETYGISHIDLDGNLIYLKDGTEEEIQRIIEFIMKDNKEYEKMKEVAVVKGIERFSYKNIAEKSISINVI